MKESAIVIQASGAQFPYTPQNGKTFTLEEMQTAVGGNIEIVSLKDTKRGAEYLMIVDEDGMLKENVQINRGATLIALMFGGIGRADCICGDVILCPARMVK